MKKKTSEVEWRTDLNDTQQKIIKLLSEDHQLSAVKLAEKIGVVRRNIENNIKKLKEYGILIRHGSPKNGYWEIIDKDLHLYYNSVRGGQQGCLHFGTLCLEEAKRAVTEVTARFFAAAGNPSACLGEMARFQQIQFSRQHHRCKSSMDF